MEKSTIPEKDLADLQARLDSSDPVPVKFIMNQHGFDYIIEQLGLFDADRYQSEQNIEINENIIGKFQAKIVYSDNSSKLISLREEK